MLESSGDSALPKANMGPHETHVQKDRRLFQDLYFIGLHIPLGGVTLKGFGGEGCLLQGMVYAR